MFTNPATELVPARTKDQLRFITCGSVDDGKSTLIGRLLHDSKMIYHDQLTALERDSIKHGSTGNDIDFALLVDGLEAEREQGITIDVAYRFFTTPRRSFMVADTPGHEQYTRNMATGASHAQLAIILIDARKGVMVQTRRHSFICSLLGIRHVVLAVNKIDLVAYNKECFDRIARDYLAFAAGLSFTSIVPIPISARYGDNVVDRSAHANWYHGPCLLEHLESIDIQSGTASQAFRFPVQWVNRPNPDFRGYAGSVASGRISTGDEIVVAASGRTTRVKRIVTHDGDLVAAEAGDAVTITLEDEIDISRGDILSRPDDRPKVADQLAAYVIWMDKEPLAPGRNYVLRIGSQTISGSITTIRHRIDVNTCEHLAAGTLSLNEIAFCDVVTATPAVFDPYDLNRKTGSFIVIDRYTNRTVGAGMIAFPLRRATNIARQALSVDRRERAALKNQKPCVIWFTGLSGAGKSTIANLVDQKLFAMSRHTMLLDGDNLRHGLNADLGFSETDRVANIRRVGEVAKLMADSGLIVICSFISPTRAERDRVRSLVGKDEFIEVFVDTPLEECARRDPKGLYSKVRSGKIKNFTGIDSCYEAPTTPEVHLRTMEQTLEHSAEAVVDVLMARSILDG
ncbi:MULTISPECIES: sulfate adenylyltransferase subunit CysN [unclassified Bradyrhizobium]|uniref:sulfate adenylyltransferase subunit CysN n=1 Tax=unclassified Bradyrhizobium TaxID=2631580 RepID=UPI001CD59F98|nr:MULTISPECIES: sulfate adenylyltransferase subunit CysN [unclassified Bradyrhizobium]MCA1385619.1 sulfate adenylyltransferase subunit CysN [Bradyrhizobium sp. BRP05]MCA1394345.1 sulfate adenylyltransferase subunit CysN [Bradyrhizobium sp. IC3123]MCA1422661.1 sulfate adenylyltransferase subunit CysN [Bradyrhizobium sp. BRP23]MCA1429100.1 sulfate adenylyltransferase subunit CysN [Bradyrhizobium sp. NBAIM16]MCA1471056.1 sulfate adenylyltransferase subunit CysN [Bradyrhizobium sp. IC3195]